MGAGVADVVGVAGAVLVGVAGAVLVGAAGAVLVGAAVVGVPGGGANTAAPAAPGRISASASTAERHRLRPSAEREVIDRACIA